MRKDQPKLRKRFKELNTVINLLKRKLKHREDIIDYLAAERKDLEQSVLVARIEYDRLFMGKAALTISYAIERSIAASLAEM